MDQSCGGLCVTQVLVELPQAGSLSARSSRFSWRVGFLQESWGPRLEGWAGRPSEALVLDGGVWTLASSAGADGV